jgi:hypothetical protein
LIATLNRILFQFFKPAIMFLNKLSVLAMLVPMAQSFRFPVIFPQLQCTIKFARLQFDFVNFDLYPTYFDDDSVATFAQAGSYTGAEDIEEYIKFGVAEFTPYNTMEELEQTPSFSLYDRETGICEFLSKLYTNRTMDPEVTSNSYQYVQLLKLKLNYETTIIEDVYLFFPIGFLSLYFDEILTAPQTFEYICSVIEGACADIIQQTNTTEECVAVLDSLPSSEGEDIRISGNTTGCRALHATFAITNPINHCAHISFPTVIDPNGKTYCQETEDTLISSLFTDAELVLVDEWAVENNIDPAVGYGGVYP